VPKCCSRCNSTASPLGTQQLYAAAITDLARYYRRSPDQLTPEEIRAYLHHLLEERKLAWSTCNVTAAAIRFFYVETLDWLPLIV
jgi:integrase/recombinase XerD